MKYIRDILAAAGIFLLGIVVGIIITAVYFGNKEENYNDSSCVSESVSAAETTANTSQMTSEPTETTSKLVEITTKATETTTIPAEITTKATETATKPAETTTKPAETTTKPAEITTANTASNGSQYPEWDSNAVYTGGETVIYNGKIYKAKWWTQNEAPGTSDVWEDTKTSPKPAETSTAATVQSTEPTENTVPPDGSFRVIGYYPSWYDGSRISPTVQLDKLTHIIYAFAIPTAEGGLRPLENPEAAKNLIAKGHSAGVKVMLAVGGWSYNDTPLEPTFVSATSTPERLNSFADEIIKMCEQYGFDGIDMDWEHPRTDGSYKQYEQLMLILAERLHEKGLLLSSAVLSGATPDGNNYYDAAAHTDKVLAAVDWINVMAYDGGDGERHSGYDFAVACGNYWLGRGVPAAKINLGVPFYGRPSWAAYRVILEQNPENANRDTADVYGMNAYYNGIPTIKKKTAYAMQKLGGIMIWELTQDAEGKDSLLSAIHSQITEI